MWRLGGKSRCSLTRMWRPEGKGLPLCLPLKSVSRAVERKRVWREATLFAHIINVSARRKRPPPYMRAANLELTGFNWLLVCVVVAARLGLNVWGERVTRKAWFRHSQIGRAQGPIFGRHPFSEGTRGPFLGDTLFLKESGTHFWETPLSRRNLGNIFGRHPIRRAQVPIFA
jgi:hypothetical protein